MRFVMAPLLLVVMACGPSAESKPIEVVTVPTPSATAKPITIEKDPPPVPTGPETAVTTGGPSLKARDPRKLLLRDGEAARLAQTLEGTSKGAGDRAKLLRDLAEDEVAESRAGDASARQKAIDAYTTLRNDYPSLPTNDEVLYYLGLEYELGSDFKNARATYYDLIKKHPQSAFIPYAYFAFGELFFQEGATDPMKLDLALQAYKEALKYPKCPLQAATLYRLGLTHKKKGDTRNASENFSRLDKEFSNSEEAKLPR